MFWIYFFVVKFPSTNKIFFKKWQIIYVHFKGIQILQTHILLFKVDVKDCSEGSETLGSFFEAKIKRITKVTINCISKQKILIRKFN